MKQKQKQKEWKIEETVEKANRDIAKGTKCYNFPDINRRAKKNQLPPLQAPHPSCRHRFRVFILFFFYSVFFFGNATSDLACSFSCDAML